MSDVIFRNLRSLSFVLPVYNEIESLPSLKEQLSLWMAAHPTFVFQIILIDDGSVDASLDFLKRWAATDNRLHIISFSRNFGHQAAVTAGLEHAQGDAVVIMDADLQDPLYVVDQMILKYQQGFDLIYGKRTSRQGETAFKKMTAWCYYRLLRSLHTDLPVDAGDFRLVSRACVQALNNLPEKNRFVRGLFAWVGFAQTFVEYERDSRKYGETKYPFSKMLRFAWTGITSFSIIPIRLVSLLGFFSALLSMLYLFYALYEYSVGKTITGWTTIVILQTFLGGSILLAIGVVGEYIGKIYEEVKCRPVYIKKLEITHSHFKSDIEP